MFCFHICAHLLCVVCNVIIGGRFALCEECGISGYGREMGVYTFV